MEVDGRQGKGRRSVAALYMYELRDANGYQLGKLSIRFSLILIFLEFFR